ncbi:MAG: Hpt domain-containing protein, partial [Pseudobdellovibrionaceae bacterium]|nr:Hpt domain-containing protein [Pseudobdellovibrionaceae bacterium]
EKIDIISSIDVSTFKSFVEFGQSCIGELMAFNSSKTFHANSDLSSMFRLLHTLKGMARTYGFSDIADVAHECEGCICIKLGSVQFEELKTGTTHLQRYLAEYIEVAHQKLNIDPTEALIRLDQALISRFCRALAENMELSKNWVWKFRCDRWLFRLPCRLAIIWLTN